MSWGNLATHASRVAFPYTEVYNGNAPGALTDLDLSSVVGAREAEVLLRFLNNQGGNMAVYCRKNGDTVTPGLGLGKSGTVANGEMCHTIVRTDTAGIIEWSTALTSGGNVVIHVERYSYA